MTSPSETLDDLGWKPYFSEQLSSEEAAHTQPVRVMAVHRGKMAVQGAGTRGFISPYISGAGPADDHPTVGDWVLIDRAGEPVRVLQRMNLFKRRAPGGQRKEQMIAA